MTDSARLVADHLEHLSRLDELRRAAQDADTAALGRLAEDTRAARSWFEQLGGLLRARREADLSLHGDIGRLRRGVAAARAAIPLEPGRRALEDVERMVDTDGGRGGLLGQAMAVHLRIARQQGLAALPALLETMDDEPPARPLSASPSARERPIAHEPPSPDMDVLRSVAIYHREHERYYTMYGFEQAAQMSRDANRLKIVADAWLSGQPSPSPISVDFADPRHQAAGCEDLNALSAIAAIGVLFMEGEGEPAEIRTLRAKLRGISVGFRSAGQWLGEKMSAAWQRESALFSAELIEAAWPRFQTIVTNWRGARRTALTGRLLELAEEHLATIEFTPEAVRARRALHGDTLRTAGWILDLAAQLLAETAIELTDNDPRWTEYRAILDRAVPPGTRR